MIKNPHTLKPVYPAYHPVFKAACRDCNRLRDSNDLLGDLEASGEYVCSKCAYLYYFDPSGLQCQRDLRELREYGGLYQSQK